MNVVLVVFDTLRKDCINFHGSPPWGPVATPHFDRFAAESLVCDRMYPESLPTLPTRRALYTTRRVYPFASGDFRLKGDFVGAPGWGPIPEDQDTLAELLHRAGYRTGLVADVYHMFKPSKNYWRGFDQWEFLRGQETDRMRSGPEVPDDVVDHYLPGDNPNRERREAFVRQCVKNMYERDHEEDYFNARVLIRASRWLEENRDAEKFFLTVESFDPHEPWFVPEHYRRMYDPGDGPEQVISGYGDTDEMAPELLKRTRANYSGLVTMCDRWFGHLMETLRVLGRLEDTTVILTTDHGHSVGDGRYIGKRGYPSHPSVYDVPLMIRHPKARGAGKRWDGFVNHTDVGRLALEAAGVEPPAATDGVRFYDRALAGDPSERDHVTVGWGSAITVITEKWWFNVKANGAGPFLHDLGAEDPFARNIADDNPAVVKELFARAVEDAGGSIPAWILKLANAAKDAPGCSALAARD